MTEAISGAELHYSYPAHLRSEHVMTLGGFAAGELATTNTNVIELYPERQPTVAISDRLRSKDPELWLTTPDYSHYDQSALVQRIESLAAALNEVIDEREFGPALEQTLGFIERAFAMYEGRSTPNYPADRVFAVPTRTSRDDPTCAREITPFLPLLDPRFGVDPDIRQRAIVGLPPSVIESYPVIDGKQGHVLFVPLYIDMAKDLGVEVAGQLSHRIINDAARFAHRSLHAEVMGLGATLASMTRFGRSIEEEGLVTTTGHGGTVYLMAEIMRAVRERQGMQDQEPVGIIGAAGSIGQATLAMYLETFPHSPIVMCDRPARAGKMAAIRSKLGSDAHRVTIAADAAEVFEKCTTIASAVTETLDLKRIRKNLAGTILLDDSQPPAVRLADAERRGITTIWAIGADGSEEGGLQRLGGYTFGDSAGLVGARSVWGCEAEVHMIARTGRYDLALNGPVTPDGVRKIAEELRDMCIGPADFQSYGQLRSLPRR